MELDIESINANCPELPKILNFDDIVNPLTDKFIVIQFFEDEITHIRNFAKNIPQQKLKEKHYRIDDDSLEKRFFTGFLGELAVNLLLGNLSLDLTIGDSKDFNVPDLPKLNIGIKTVEWGKFPIVSKNPRNSEIINIVKGNTVFVCGIATIDNLKKNSSDDLVLSRKLVQRNVKTGFYGFNELKFFTKEKFEKVISQNLVRKHLNK
jgi:hypothetical protein